MQDKLRETRSRSRAMSKLNPRNFEIDSKLTEVMSERNVITERVKRGLSGHADNLADAMSLPDNHINVNTDRETVVNNHELGKSQSVPKLGLKNSLVTKTHDNGSLRLLDLLRKTHFSTAEKRKEEVESDEEDESHFAGYLMPSGLNSTAQLQSPGQGVFDLMKSTSSVNSMTSGNQVAERMKQSSNKDTSNFVNIVGMHKNDMKTARKGPKNGDVKTPINAALSETHSPGVSTIPKLTQITSVQSTKNVTSASEAQPNLKQTQSTKPTKPTSSFKSKPSVKPKN